MLTFASVLIALAGIGLLALMPLPKDHRQRLVQRALGATLFAAGIGGVIAVVFFKGQIVG